MGAANPVMLGSALLWVLLALADHSSVVARFLCLTGQHRWRSSAVAPRHRTCVACHRHETARTHHARPWEWR